MACEDHAVPSRPESSAVGNTQRRNGGTRKGHHNPQADASLYRLENSQTRYTKSLQLARGQYHSARISEITWSKLENVRDSTTQTVAWVTHRERGHHFPAGLSAHPLQLAVAGQSIQPAVAIDALWRSEGNDGFALCRDSPPREGGGLGSGDLL